MSQSHNFVPLFFWGGVHQRGIDPATRQDPSMMAMLLEMGFRDQRLNEKLLRKHSYSLQHAVNDLVQMSEENQNQAVDALH